MRQDDGPPLSGAVEILASKQILPCFRIEYTATLSMASRRRSHQRRLVTASPSLVFMAEKKLSIRLLWWYCRSMWGSEAQRPSI